MKPNPLVEIGVVVLLFVYMIICMVTSKDTQPGLYTRRKRDTNDGK
jgi:hypothetical protein